MDLGAKVPPSLRGDPLEYYRSLYPSKLSTTKKTAPATPAKHSLDVIKESSVPRDDLPERTEQCNGPSISSS